MSNTRNTTKIAALHLAAVIAIGPFVAACGNTMQGAKQDTANAADKVAGAAETVDVKAALIADRRVDTSDLNVDTNSNTNTVVLKGSVPTAEQRTIAEQIARDQARGYKVINQLTVAKAG